VRDEVSNPLAPHQPSARELGEPFEEVLRSEDKLMTDTSTLWRAAEEWPCVQQTSLAAGVAAGRFVLQPDGSAYPSPHERQTAAGCD
jgi:hypothetical protein